MGFLGGTGWFAVASHAAPAPSLTAEAMTLAREAAAAASSGDAAGYLQRMEAAVALRSDLPRMWVNLAAAQVAQGQPEAAVASLGRLADLGLHSPVEKAPEFEPLRARPDFEAVRKRLAANLVAEGRGLIDRTLRDVTGLIEGIAWRARTGAFYFGDVNDRAVWIQRPDGTRQRFTPEGDELWGVFGLVVDEPAGALWAATSAVPAMRGFTPDLDGTAALAEIDLESGAVRRVIPVRRVVGDRESHVLGDLALAPDGALLLPDSGAPVIWRLAPGAADLEPWVTSPEFLSLQGIVVSPEGGFALVADHANGLLRVDLGSRQVTRLEPPAGSTLVGLDGLVALPGGGVVAIQNGTRPARVLQVRLDEAAETVLSVRVLERGHLAMAAPSLGCLGPEGEVYFIGNAGWSRFELNGGEPTPPRSVPVFRTRWEKPPAKGR